jgi:hypothetical protein
MVYDIGYRRPPPSGQFKKGISGNPKGRPKGSKNLLSLLEQELSEKVVVHENGRRKTVTRMQAIVKRMVAGALQGEPKAVLTLVNLLQRNGGIEPPDVEALLPPDYEQVLEAYVQSRKAGAKKP